MNYYTILNMFNEPLGQSYAITPGAAVIAWRRVGATAAVRAVRTEDVQDEVSKYADMHCQAFSKPDRQAYRASHRFVRLRMLSD